MTQERTELEARLEAQSRRIEELENLVFAWKNNGAAHLFAGHGFSQIGRFWRLGNYGMQVLVPPFDEAARTAIWFVNESDGFSPQDPTGNYGAIRAGVSQNGTAGVDALELFIQNATGNDRATLTLYPNLYIVLDSNPDLSGHGYLAVVGSGASDSYVQIGDPASAAYRNYLWLVGRTADPSAFAGDGAIWYRSDTDKFRGRANGATENLAIESWVTAGFVASGVVVLGAGSELTIASGVVTATSGYHRIDTEADAASDDLDTISGLTTGQLLVIRAENSARTVVVKNGTGNIQLDGASDFSLDNVEDTLTLIYNGSAWLEISKSDNGV